MINIDKCIQIVKGDFPKITKDQIEIFDDGWDYLVLVVNRKDTFRFPRTDEYIKKLPLEVNFVKEFKTRSPITIPNYQLHQNNEIGPYVTYPFIPGVQFLIPVAKTFSKDNLSEIAHQLGKFLSSLHSMPIEKVKDMGISQTNPVEDWQKKLAALKKYVFPYIPNNQQEWTIKLFNKFVKLIRNHPFEMTVIHTDIMPEHIIVDPDKQTLSGIIDFGDVEIGDPAFDFASLHWYGDDFLAEVYKSYSLPRDEYFELRRKFYIDRLLLSWLNHSLKIKDKLKVQINKEKLTDYIKQNPL